MINRSIYSSGTHYRLSCLANQCSKRTQLLDVGAQIETYQASCSCNPVNPAVAFLDCHDPHCHIYVWYTVYTQMYIACACVRSASIDYNIVTDDNPTHKLHGLCMPQHALVKCINVCYTDPGMNVFR